MMLIQRIMRRKQIGRLCMCEFVKERVKVKVNVSQQNETRKREITDRFSTQTKNFSNFNSFSK